MIAAAFDIGIPAGSAENVPVFALLGLLIVFPITAWLTLGTGNRYRKIFARFQPLIKNIEDGKPNGAIGEILKKLKEQLSPVSSLMGRTRFLVSRAFYEDFKAQTIRIVHYHVKSLCIRNISSLHVRVSNAVLRFEV